MLPNLDWLLVIVVLWLLVLSFFLFQTVWHYRRLTSGITKKDLKNLLEEILKKLELRDEEINHLTKASENLRKDGIKHIQKIGFMRYNPFKDTGGDQSFILALLDSEDNGIILSSFHGREGTRIYAKKIKVSKGDNFALSEEEEKVIKLAKNRR
jgi:hypothetical protein